MAVTKLPRTRKGILSQFPPLSWPNDTAIGRHRPDHGLLRQATRNRQQHRLSKLSASSKHEVPKLPDDPLLRFQAPRALGYSRYKAHKRTRHSIQQSKPPRKPHPLTTQLAKSSQVSNNSLIDNKEDAKTRKCDKIAAKGIDWPAYDRAKAHRLKKIRIWVQNLHQSHRIVDSVAKELMAYYGKEKFGEHPSARSLSEHAWQAVKLCEHEFGTDLQWGKSLGEEVWGSDYVKVEKLIQMKMEGEGTPGRGTVGESDLSELEDEGQEDGVEDADDEEGFWGDGGGKNVEMVETA